MCSRLVHFKVPIRAFSRRTGLEFYRQASRDRFKHKPIIRDGVWRLGQPFEGDMWGGVLQQPKHEEISDMPLMQHLMNLADPAEMITMEDLVHTGVMYGHKVSEWNPKMRPYIYGERKGYHVIDLYSTLASVRNVGRMVQYVILSGGQVLWVNYERSYDGLARHYSSQCGQPLMSDRWRPGFYTNFGEVMKNAQRNRKIMIEPNEVHLRGKRKAVARRLKAVQSFSTLEGLPSITFFVSLKKAQKQLYEGYLTHIPSVALVDTDSDPNFVAYPIACNDENPNSVALICSVISRSIQSAMEYKEKKKRDGISFERW